MVGPIKSLLDLQRHGGAVRAECQGCGKVAIFATGDLLRYWQAKGWSVTWPDFAKHLRCGHCDQLGPMVTWITETPPPPDPEPPKPRFARAGNLAAPEQTNVVELESRRRRRA